MSVRDIPISTILLHVQQTGADVAVASSENVDTPGWSVRMAFDKPHKDARPIQTPMGMIMGIPMPGEDDDEEERPSADTSVDFTHTILIVVWDANIERAVRRAAESFMAAYSTSVSEFAALPETEEPHEHH